MNKSVKFLTVLFVVFLMPLAAYAEMWSPDRFRLNLRVAGSMNDSSVGAKTLKYKCPDAGGSCTTYSISDGTILANAAALDKQTSKEVGGITLQYIMEMGMIVGIHQHTTKYDTLATQTGAWTASTAGGATSAVGAFYANALGALYPSGTKLADRTSEGYVNFLDLGYFYDLSDIVGGMNISGGIGLPLLGNGGSTKVAYTAAGYALNGGVLNEDITADDGSAMSFFVDYGYTFGSYEALLGLRTISTESKATVDETKGLGKILGETTFTSSGSSTSYSLGFGYVF
jgi:hypothetical protein